MDLDDTDARGGSVILGARRDRDPAGSRLDPELGVVEVDLVIPKTVAVEVTRHQSQGKSAQTLRSAELMAAHGKPQKVVELAAFIIDQPSVDEDALSKAEKLRAQRRRSSEVGLANSWGESVEELIDEVLCDPFLNLPCDTGTARAPVVPD